VKKDIARLLTRLNEMKNKWQIQYLKSLD
jgi:ribosomal protein L29